MVEKRRQALDDRQPEADAARAIAFGVADLIELLEDALLRDRLSATRVCLRGGDGSRLEGTAEELSFARAPDDQRRG
jgi:hypothetical protein